MRYEIIIMSTAQKDMRAIHSDYHARISRAILAMGGDLSGDVKKLTNNTPEYRLRVGNYRVLFSIVEGTIMIHRILHRRDAYKH